MREFAVKLDAPVEEVIERCAADGVNPGYPAASDDGLLVAITEQRTREDIDRLVDGRCAAAVAGASAGRR